MTTLSNLTVTLIDGSCDGVVATPASRRFPFGCLPLAIVKLRRSQRWHAYAARRPLLRSHSFARLFYLGEIENPADLYTALAASSTD